MTAPSAAALDDRSNEDRRRYPGVRSFTEADAARFFGRSRVAQELLLRVLSVRLLLQFAPSGVGKTSVLQAGLFPLLRPHGMLPLMVRLNRTDETLTAAIRRSLAEAATEQHLLDSVIPLDAPDAAALLAGTQLWTDELSLLTPVLVFDQFEEAFTLRDEAFRRGFAQDIGALVATRGQARAAETTATKVIISLREEFLGRLDDFTADIPELFRERLRLAPLSRDEASLCTTAPTELEGDGWDSPRFGFSPACLDALLDFIGGSAARHGAIEPLTLQLVCRHGESLIIERRGQGAALPMLELADFGGLPGLTKLVAEYFKLEISKLPTAAARRSALDLFEQGLLDPAGKRLMLEEGEIQRDHSLPQPVLDALVESHLLRREPRNDRLFYEISHDRLAEAIARQRRARLPLWVVPALAGAGLFVVMAVIGIVWVRGKEADTKAALRESEKAYGLVLGNTLVPHLVEAGAAEALKNVLLAIADPATGQEVPPAVLIQRHQGDLDFDRATLAQARTHFKRGLVELDKSPHAGAAEPQAVRAERARLLGRLGNVETDAGHLVLARRHFDAAAALWAQVLAAAAQLDERMDAAELYMALTSLALRQGEPEAAERLAAQAMDTLLQAWLGAHADPRNGSRNMAFEQGRTLQIMADAMLIHAQVWNKHKPFAAAAALAQEALRLRPLSALAKRQLATANAMLGGAQSGQGGDTLLGLLEDAAQTMDHLMRFDPDNLRLRREYVAARLYVVAWLANCSAGPQCKGRIPALRKAQTQVTEAIGDMRWLASLDPENMSLRSDISWSLAEQARLHVALGNDAGAIALLDAAVAEKRRARGVDVDHENLVTVAELLMWRARLQAGRADTRQAVLDSMAQAMKEIEPLQQASPGAQMARANLLADQETLLRQLKRSGQADAVQAQKKALLQTLGTPWDAQSERASEADAKAVDLINQAAPMDPWQALSLQDQAVHQSLRAIAADPSRVEYWHNLRDALALLSNSRKKAEEKVQATASEPALPAAPAASAALDIIEAVASNEASARAATVAAATVAHVLSDDQNKSARQTYLYNARRDLALYHRDHNGGPVALALARDGVFQSRDMAAGKATSAPHLTQLRDAYYGVGLMRFATGAGGWEEPIRIALSYGDALVRLLPHDASHRLSLGQVQADLGLKFQKGNRADAAAAAFRQGRLHCRAALALAEAPVARQEAKDCIHSLPAEFR